VTSLPDVLGPEYDAPSGLASNLLRHETKRNIALVRLKRIEQDGDPDEIRMLYWELGLADLNVLITDDRSPFGGGEYENFARFYLISEETVPYARARADETKDVILKIHYLTFVLLRSEPRGRAWIALQRELAEAYREFISRCRDDAERDPKGFVGVYIDQALASLRPLLERPGMIPDAEAADWAEWIAALADDSRLFREGDERRREQQRHRWVAPYLSMLTALPADAENMSVRTLAMHLLAEARTYYASDPLNDEFERLVVETEAAIRKHWGEAGTHEGMILHSVDTLRRRAAFHRSTGTGMLTAHFYREARRIVAAHRQYFTERDIADLQSAEQTALAQAVAVGEFKEIGVPMSIPIEDLDLTRETSTATVDGLAEFARRSVPKRDALAAEMAIANRDTPLRGMIGRTIISRDKVVGEAKSEEKNLNLDVEHHAMQLSRLHGAVVGTTVIRAAAAVGLLAQDLLRPLDRLSLTAETRTLIEHAGERLIAKDFISAVHILIPQCEDVLRQHLRATGVDTTRFEPDIGDGSSRTDDATLGALMHRSLPDGRSVREYLGRDLWLHFDSVLNSQTGLNLRNEVAHGLVRPAACSAETGGLALMLLYQLAAVPA
jgi:hypothetical protein